jgi:hypothetical protein
MAQRVSHDWRITSLSWLSLVRGEVAAVPDIQDASSSLAVSLPHLLRRSITSMEGIAAFGLAANILQVVELAYKLLSSGQEVYQAGTTLQNAELEVALKDFTVLNKRLQSSVRPVSDVFGPLTADGHVCIVPIGIQNVPDDNRRVWSAWHSTAKRSRWN